ncbi:diguanylate cyclase (GGDEF) domain-containing protein [Xenococcus sp. PCC 7305]|uniref:GGDEF domain-containing protein n=1 Tax=Xenococcus sp. PCC 7305 TaxID=102125 RepID=UPI0002AD1702|nr:diguanylate cyclase [Xenococcus sp. PCC 7305]ELS03400.1 diguanylate cyclase (GGDEF) domain-containing protein [Xenococcus sp. PCC 7305]
MENSNQSIVDNDEVIFADEDEMIVADEPINLSPSAQDSWKILLVDDDVEIHKVTILALGDLEFEGKPVTFFNAYSGEDAKQIIRENSDIAMILLDVIMETEDAGLEVVKYVRNVLQNRLVRIILRTGQPGKVPEDTIVLSYDINDYKTKTELTRKNLLTKVITSLRGFSALIRIEKSKQELSDIALENAKLYEQIEKYAHTLEDKVAERTRELEIKNRQLELEIKERKIAERSLQELNQKLERLVNVDGLTGVANRRHFDDYLDREWRRLKREQKPLSLILCDVDHFKLYNDSYGHLQGDDCLRQVAQTIAQVIQRPADLVARYGGEEFGIILPNTEIAGTHEVAKKVQQAIRDLKLPHNCSQTSQFVTISMAISCQVPYQAQTIEDLIRTTDQALYSAKAQGRDRIIINH